MDDNTSKEILELSKRIADLVKQEVRPEYPFLKTSALSHIVEACGSVVRGTLTEQTPVMEASKANKRASLLGVPGELRNRIYDFVFESDRPSGNGVEICVQDMIRSKWHWDRDWDWRKQNDRKWVRKYHVSKRYLSVAQVCTRMRRESLSVFLGRQAFVAYYHSKDSRWCWRGIERLEKWLSCLGPEHVRQIKRLSLRRTDLKLSHCYGQLIEDVHLPAKIAEIFISDDHELALNNKSHLLGLGLDPDAVETLRNWCHDKPEEEEWNSWIRAKWEMWKQELKGNN